MRTRSVELDERRDEANVAADDDATTNERRLRDVALDATRIDRQRDLAHVDEQFVVESAPRRQLQATARIESRRHVAAAERAVALAQRDSSALKTDVGMARRRRIADNANRTTDVRSADDDTGGGVVAFDDERYARQRVASVVDVVARDALR